MQLKGLENRTNVIIATQISLNSTHTTVKNDILFTSVRGKIFCSYFFFFFVHTKNQISKAIIYYQLLFVPIQCKNDIRLLNWGFGGQYENAYVSTVASATENYHNHSPMTLHLSEFLNSVHTN